MWWTNKQTVTFIFNHSWDDLDLQGPWCVHTELDVGRSGPRAGWARAAAVWRKWQTCEGLEEKRRRGGNAGRPENVWTVSCATRRQPGIRTKLHILGHSFRFVLLMWSENFLRQYIIYFLGTRCFCQSTRLKTSHLLLITVLLFTLLYFPLN